MHLSCSDVDAESWTSDDENIVALKLPLHERPNLFEPSFCTLQQRVLLSSRAEDRAGRRRGSIMTSSRKNLTRWTRADRSWVALLERHNATLISQINTLTSDLLTTERHLRRSLQRTERQVAHLKTHIFDQERLHKVAVTTHICQIDTLRAKLSQEALTNSRKYTTMQDHSERLENEIRGLLHDRALLKQMADRREDEVLRVKQRNAKLAERIITQGAHDILTTPLQQCGRTCKENLDSRERADAHDGRRSLGLPSPPTPTTLSSIEFCEIAKFAQHLPPRIIEFENQYQIKTQRLESLDKERFLRSLNFKSLEDPLTPNSVHCSSPHHSSAQRQYNGSIAATLDGTLISMTEHTKWNSLKNLLSLTTATEQDDDHASSSRNLAAQQWYHPSAFNSGKAKSMPMAAAVRALQWACFVICLVLAAGLTLKEGPRSPEQNFRHRFSDAILPDYDSHDKDDDSEL